ncbi:hypothetical protein PVAP13_2KG422106 [Panicum virgatum]|uniref:Uncharacterized protein n=1 Tax=Panicum virgatum TaxID=38727 RepID=A0A8T0WA69_PANVG|nr:hypothetical protein PVAP13_2KG422106 [Panicum virgatum]
MTPLAGTATEIPTGWTANQIPSTPGLAWVPRGPRRRRALASPPAVAPPCKCDTCSLLFFPMSWNTVSAARRHPRRIGRFPRRARTAGGRRPARRHHPRVHLLFRHKRRCIDRDSWPSPPRRALHALLHGLLLLVASVAVAVT